MPKLCKGDASQDYVPQTQIHNTVRMNYHNTLLIRKLFVLVEMSIVETWLTNAEYSNLETY